jgi:hypothetical protein
VCSGVEVWFRSPSGSQEKVLKNQDVSLSFQNLRRLLQISKGPGCSMTAVRQEPRPFEVGPARYRIGRELRHFPCTKVKQVLLLHFFPTSPQASPQTMSRPITLFCLAHCDPRAEPFPVKIDEEESSGISKGPILLPIISIIGNETSQPTRLKTRTSMMHKS